MGIRVLVVGGGGREDALVKKIGESPLVDKDGIFCVPGNAGIADKARCEPTLKAEDIFGLLNFAQAVNVDLTVVGPEDPLAMGIVGAFEKEGLPCFGVSAPAARLEADKVFAYELMVANDIPTPHSFASCTHAKALDYLVGTYGSHQPVVIKASGLAKGKGALVCANQKQAVTALGSIMLANEFGPAGDWVLVQQYLRGVEVTVKAITDGETVVLLPSSQDRKAAFTCPDDRARWLEVGGDPAYADYDMGPNTGGMAATAPAPVMTPEMTDRVRREILEPIVRAMAAEGRLYKGVVYAGLMITEDGPKVLEFNCRLGDPETQVVLPLLRTDPVELMMAACEGRLGDVPVEYEDGAAACVVLASGGYPGHNYQKGFPIAGLEEAGAMDGVTVYHAGTAIGDGRPVTNGGRVLGVTGLGVDVSAALARAYEAVEKIRFEKMYYCTNVRQVA